MDHPQGRGVPHERAAAPPLGAVSCETCGRAIPDVYYESAGQVLCSVCKDAVLATQQGGSRLGRLGSALALGAVAAAVSAAGWYAIIQLTGYELGLVALVVGLLVGGAVRVGARARGGWLYQTIAVALTYLAIVGSYVPLFVEGFREEATAEASFTEPDADGAAMAETDAPSPEAMEAALWTGAVVIAFVWPVYQVSEGGFMGLAIVAFALYEAWKLNRRQARALAGPFRIDVRTGLPAG